LVAAEVRLIQKELLDNLAVLVVVLVALVGLLLVVAEVELLGKEILVADRAEVVQAPIQHDLVEEAVLGVEVPQVQVDKVGDWEDKFLRLLEILQIL
jgi:hypothetical protein